MDFNSFSHGQIHSKIWLCDILQPYLHNKKITILGCWYNVLGLMLLLKNNDIDFIVGVDKDADAIEIADQICQSHRILPHAFIKNICMDVDDYDFGGQDIVINCSVEHMSSNKWFDNIKNDTIVCLQTSNFVTDDPYWDIKNPNPNFETFKLKYPMSQILFEGEKVFDYGNVAYTRYMLIGKKNQ